MIPKEIIIKCKKLTNLCSTFFWYLFVQPEFFNESADLSNMQSDSLGYSYTEYRYYTLTPNRLNLYSVSLQRNSFSTTIYHTF